jgi:hypothetical protein
VWFNVHIRTFHLVALGNWVRRIKKGENAEETKTREDCSADRAVKIRKKKESFKKKIGLGAGGVAQVEEQYLAITRPQVKAQYPQNNKERKNSK